MVDEGREGEIVVEWQVGFRNVGYGGADYEERWYLRERLTESANCPVLRAPSDSCCNRAVRMIQSNVTPEMVITQSGKKVARVHSKGCFKKTMPCIENQVAAIDMILI